MKNLLIKLTKPLAFTFILFLFVNHQVCYAAQPKIKTINNISCEVYENKSFNLPSNIKAIMSNGTYKQLLIKWNTNSVATSNIGQYKFYGTVKGYSKKVILTLNIKTMPILTIDNLNMNIDQYEKFSFPESVNAKLIDNKYKQYEITWESSTVDTNISGVKTIYGKVKAYNNNVKLTLNIIPKLRVIDIQ